MVARVEPGRSAIVMGGLISYSLEDKAKLPFESRSGVVGDTDWTAPPK
jgi:hypothetical protein